MNKVLLYHKNCPDGLGAALAASMSSNPPDLYIPVTHHEELSLSLEELDVIIADFCYPRDQLLKLKSTARSLVVLDHHKTAEADCKGLDFCIFDMNRSGAGLAWDYFHPNTPRPLLIDLIEYRDLGHYWNNKVHEGKFLYIKELLSYVDSFDKNIQVWYNLLQRLEHPTLLNECIIEGQAILRYQKSQIEYLAKSYHYVDLFGVRYPAVNTSTYQSDVANHLAERHGGVGATYHILSNGMVKFSLRSSPSKFVDVSEIAKQFGGGGHSMASGFTLSSIADIKICK
jgi:oligoribonuclease NrnB/cAMP/cGMP phosphodiesterase (DHH superfamily)